MLDLGANLQAATDMARFRHDQVPNKLEMESEPHKLVGAHLQAMGHAVESVNGSRVGGYQSIMFVPTTPPAAMRTCRRSWRLLPRRLRPSQGRPGGWVVTSQPATRRRRVFTARPHPLSPGRRPSAQAASSAPASALK